MQAMKYRIKHLRTLKGWTLAELARKVGTSQGYLSDLERGKRTGSIPMLRALAKVFEVLESEIFEPESEQDLLVMEHMTYFMSLSPEDQEAVCRHARSLCSSDPILDRIRMV